MLLTVADAAKLLHTNERQVYRWVDDEEIPFQRVRDQVRFNRTELLEWASSRRLPVSLELFDEGSDPDEHPPSLAAALRAGGVHEGVPGTTRDEVLRAVVERIPLPPTFDRELLTEMLLVRERSATTAVGEGIAIPHVRHPVVAPGWPPAVTVCYLAAPVSFEAPDGAPVHTVFLVVSPTVRAHLQMLAHLARAFHDPGFRAALARRAGVDELILEATKP